MQGISLSFVVGYAIMLWRAAASARTTAKQKLTNAISSAKDHRAKDDDAGAAAARKDKDVGDGNRYAEQLETLLSRVDQIREGAFSRLSEQPLVRAVLMPLLSIIGAPVLNDMVEQIIRMVILGM